MDFAAPGRLLWLAAVAAWALVVLVLERVDRRRLAVFGDRDRLDDLTDPAVANRRWVRWLGVAGLALTVFAAARPRFGLQLSEVKRRGNEVFVALDTSASMLAEDVHPNRMAKAKRSLGLLISSLTGDRVGIIAFAGDAYLACPLTLDIDAAGMFLEAVDVGAAPVPGTALGAAVRRAVSRFPKGSRAEKIVVLLTDGEDTRDSNPLGAAKDAAAAGVKLYTIGLGTPQGEVIRERNADGSLKGFKKDDKGETVVSRLDEATLAEMARLTGGEYFRSSDDDAEIPALVARVSSAARQVQSTQVYKIREERYQPFLLIAILLLILERLIPRRTGHWHTVLAQLRQEPWRLELPKLRWPRLRRPRILGGAAGTLLLLAALVAPAAADYKSHLRKGNRHFANQRVDEARQEYYNAQADLPESPEAPYNIGNTWLSEGKFDEAVKSFDQAHALAKHPQLKSVTAYNKGCALFYAGREDEAIEAFKVALRWDPKDADAKYNIEWIRSPKRPKQQKGGQGDPKDGPKPKPDQLSKEDAERVLEMVRDQEKRKRDEENKKKKQDPKSGGGRDW